MSASLAALSVSEGVVAAKHNSSCSTFANRIIYTPPEGTLLLYPRVTELSDGTILATIGWRGDPPADLPYFPVFASKDGGWSWENISNITDQVNGLGMTAQPALAELPCK